MSSVTPNLNLVLPVGEENVSRQVINDNMGKIDTAYGNLQGGVMRKVPFSVTVGDWVLDDGVYVAEFATEYVTASSSEFAFYTSSYSQYAVSDIVMDKKPGGGALVFTTTDLPTGTIAGTLYVFDNNDGKIPVIMEDTVLPIANGGTGENTLAGAKNALGIEQLESDVADINAHLVTLDYLKDHVRANGTDFTSWSFQVPNTAGAGLLLGFDEVWAFSYASTNSIGAKQVAHAMRSQGDRGFSFAYDSSTRIITVTTTQTVWGGATVFFN